MSLFWRSTARCRTSSGLVKAAASERALTALCRRAAVLPQVSFEAEAIEILAVKVVSNEDENDELGYRSSV